MQKTQAPNDRVGGVSNRIGRQTRRRGSVWLVPAGSPVSAAPLTDQLPQIVGALALDEDPSRDAPTHESAAPACVLIVEDDPQVSGLLRSALELEGHSNWAIDIQPEGRTALSRAQANTPNLVLLDVQLPDMDGAEVYRRLRSVPTTANCHVVFLTASTSLDLSVRGVDGGLLVRKPFDVEQVIELVTALLQ
ncbi:MAG TPA: response regulator [Ktedonobacterales bacterium]|jgi:CheY-like chemotaxis protein|nr:response regulator [Ktedonobacterales bacterium]